MVKISCETGKRPFCDELGAWRTLRKQLQSIISGIDIENLFAHSDTLNSFTYYQRISGAESLRTTLLFHVVRCYRSLKVMNTYRRV